MSLSCLVFDIWLGRTTEDERTDVGKNRISGRWGVPTISRRNAIDFARKRSVPSDGSLKTVFLPRDAVRIAQIVPSQDVCLSVCLSVRLSHAVFTFGYSDTILVCHRKRHGNIPTGTLLAGGGASNADGMKKRDFRLISCFISEMIQYGAVVLNSTQLNSL